MALLDDIAAPNLLTHWQPDPTIGSNLARTGLRAVLPRLAHVHTFFWGPGGIDERHPLAAGESMWRPLLSDTADASVHAPLQARFALLEYVRDDDAPEQLIEDAATLRCWLKDVAVRP